MTKGKVVVLKDKVVEQEGVRTWITDTLLVRKWPGDKEVSYLTHERKAGSSLEAGRPLTRQEAKELIEKSHGIKEVR